MNNLFLMFLKIDENHTEALCDQEGVLSLYPAAIKATIACAYLGDKSSNLELERALSIL